jgi:hypothetical protein
MKTLMAFMVARSARSCDGATQHPNYGTKTALPCRAGKLLWAPGRVADLRLGLCYPKAMSTFTITRGGTSQTFTPGADFADGDTHEHWTLSGLEKLIALGLWERKLDRRGTVLRKPPTVEQVRGVATASVA